MVAIRNGRSVRRNPPSLHMGAQWGRRIERRLWLMPVARLQPSTPIRSASWHASRPCECAGDKRGDGLGSPAPRRECRLACKSTVADPLEKTDRESEAPKKRGTWGLPHARPTRMTQGRVGCLPQASSRPEPTAIMDPAWWLRESRPPTETAGDSRTRRTNGRVGLHRSVADQTTVPGGFRETSRWVAQTEIGHPLGEVTGDLLIVFPTDYPPQMGVVDTDHPRAGSAKHPLPIRIGTSSTNGPPSVSRTCGYARSHLRLPT